MRGNANNNGVSNKVKLNPRKEKWKVDMSQVELRLKEHTHGQSCLHRPYLGLVLKFCMPPQVRYRFENVYPWDLIILAFHASFQKAFIKLKALV